MLKNIDAKSDEVAGIGAANTLVFTKKGVAGYNTDCAAAIESLRKGLNEKHPDEDNVFKDRKVLLLGAGGVARAIAYGLLKEGAEVLICARDYKKSEALATALDCKSVDWIDRGKGEYQAMVNCTPVGMHPNMNDSPFEAEWFDKRAVVFDTVYNPEQTLFIKQAREADCLTVTGIDMFVSQAAKQFKLFTGTEPDMETIRFEIKRAISAAKY